MRCPNRSKNVWEEAKIIIDNKSATLSRGGGGAAAVFESPLNRAHTTHAS
jgi:hypothetical protein